MVVVAAAAASVSSGPSVSTAAPATVGVTVAGEVLAAGELVVVFIVAIQTSNLANH